ncbi:MAG: IgGFc-binding protein, partial [Paludibacteraceae bacterium]|nr:IgGFc-binding protein [Paludibacteraceae bacterium]
MKLMQNIRMLVWVALCSLMALSPSVFAQNGTEGIQTTEGNNFWATFMSNNGANVDEATLRCCLYFTLTEVQSHDVTIVVEIGGVEYDRVTIPAGQSYAKMEDITPSLAYIPINDVTKEEQEMIVPKGIHAYSLNPNDKFGCYGYCRVGAEGSTRQDAMLILPKDGLGKEYIIQTYWTASSARSTEFAVVATENDTKVEIVPSVPTRSEKEAYSTITITLDAGEAYLVPSARFGQNVTVDLSGSTICASKPVAVFTGNESEKMPISDAYSTNYFMEQMLPISYWGTEFYFAKAAKTLENRYNISAAFDGTVVKLYRANETMAQEQTYTLQQGQSLFQAGVGEGFLKLPSTFTTAYIETSKPVICYHYLTSGAA